MPGLMDATVEPWDCSVVSQMFRSCYAAGIGPFTVPSVLATAGLASLLLALRGTGSLGCHIVDAGLPGQPAELGRRFGALVVDWILCVLASGLFARPLTQGWAPLLVLIAEYGFFLGLFGVTPGMFVARIRCVRVSDGGPLGIPRALLRGVLLALIVPALIMDENRRGLHDKAANSIVVSA
jgi:RDD family